MTIRKSVLDKGFVDIIDYMGSDLTVVNAARVSFNRSIETLSLRDEHLIKYLAEHKHWTPFAHPQLQFRVKMPIFVARQWYRSNVGLVRSEISRRYVDEAPDFHIPDFLRERSDSLKQGSKNTSVENSEQFIHDIWDLYRKSDVLYEGLLSHGVCPEQAREVLPLATYTEFIETGSLYAYARVYVLRNKNTEAQKEIMEYAEAIGALIADTFPISWKYLTGG